MFFYYKKNEIKNGKLICVYQSKSKLNNEQIEFINKTQNNLLLDTVIYENDIPFEGYPILKNDLIRKATDKELIELGIITLKIGEKLKGDNIIQVSKLSWQYKWENDEWTPDENKLYDGQYIENKKIKYIPYNDDLGYILPIWDKKNHIWKEKATDLDKIRAQYNEYKPLNNPLTFIELEEQGLKQEYIDMMRQLQMLIIQLEAQKNQIVTFKEIKIPVPSEKLIRFKTIFNLL